MNSSSIRSVLLYSALLVLIASPGVFNAVWNENILYHNPNVSYVYSNTPYEEAQEPPSIYRQSRRNPLIDACTTNEGTSGTCLTRFNCMRQGGTPKGFCTSYGVCCETNIQCGRNSNLKRTIIKNPVQLPTSCQYTITPYSSNVCQLLIEFQRFELRTPTADTASATLTCTDSFSVGGYTLCGENNGQHLYLPFNVAAGASQILLDFSLPTQYSLSTWYLVVTQLECPAAKKRVGNGVLLPFMGQTNLQDLRTIFSTKHSDLDLLAPPGCLQYFRDPAGQIKSFGSDYYLADMKYTICIKPLPGTTMIEYTVNRFSLSAEQDGLYYDESCHPTIYTEGRQNDYLMIPNAMFRDNMDFQPTYYCGLGLTTSQVLVATAPYIMYFSSDSQWSSVETGFSISYVVRTTIN
ncbi:uncharacterized protein LOC118756976 [Rhagoletis pomonella]|uniref:uncharacterized protein LOC118756976 n=2 Tax=Rhagoletis pomonella TaxID=28610 RepID=UPI00177B18B5|nr:uncharacterized protein LOC118756976 [Rhagoletis pomonella]